MDRCAGYYARPWILLAGPNSSSRAGGQSQLLNGHGVGFWLTA